MRGKQNPTNHNARTSDRSLFVLTHIPATKHTSDRDVRELDMIAIISLSAGLQQHPPRGRARPAQLSTRLKMSWA